MILGALRGMYSYIRVLTTFYQLAKANDIHFPSNLVEPYSDRAALVAAYFVCFRPLQKKCQKSNSAANALIRL